MAQSRVEEPFFSQEKPIKTGATGRVGCEHPVAHVMQTSEQRQRHVHHLVGAGVGSLVKGSQPLLPAQDAAPLLLPGMRMVSSSEAQEPMFSASPDALRDILVPQTGLDSLVCQPEANGSLGAHRRRRVPVGAGPS